MSYSSSILTEVSSGDLCVCKIYILKKALRTEGFFVLGQNYKIYRSFYEKDWRSDYCKIIGNAWD